jgi:UDP:flavonoid glycosyltransferase YjiC (YdhE family)
MFMLYIMANLIEGDFTKCFADWGPLVDVVGYCFLNLGSKYQPQDNFLQWIQKGSEPIYIGFGSMVW